MHPIPVALNPPACMIAVLGQTAGAGFPSPAADYAQDRLDMNELLIKRPAATFCMRVSGASMVGAGILDGSLVVVDRSLKAGSGRIVVAVLDGHLVIKRLRVERAGTVFLDSDPAPGEEGLYPPVEIAEGMQFEVWGCVTASVAFVS